MEERRTLEATGKQTMVEILVKSEQCTWNLFQEVEYDSLKRFRSTLATK
jgi:hypothetical protein